MIDFDSLSRDARNLFTIEEIFGDLPEVAPGVHAALVERDTTLFINVVWSENENAGNVGRWLDGLQYERIIVPAVFSHKFAGMLARRGFRYSEAADSWIRTTELTCICKNHPFFDAGVHYINCPLYVKSTRVEI